MLGFFPIAAAPIADEGVLSVSSAGTGSVAVAPSLSGSAQQRQTATGGVALAESISGAGQQRHSATGSVAVAAPSLSGSGQQRHAATGSGAIAESLNGTGQQRHTATGAVSVAVSLAGSGSVAGVSSASSDFFSPLLGFGAIAETPPSQSTTPVTGSGAAAVSLSLEGLGDTPTTRRSGGFIYPIRRPTQHVQGDGAVGLALAVDGSAGLTHGAAGGVAIRMRADGVSVTLDPGPEFVPAIESGAPVGVPAIVATPRIIPAINGTGSIAVAVSTGADGQVGNAATGSVAVTATLDGSAQQEHSAGVTIAIEILLASIGRQKNASPGGSIAMRFSTSGDGNIVENGPSPPFDEQQELDDDMAVIAALYYEMV